MTGRWLLLLLEAWQPSGVCDQGQVQVVHVDDMASRKTDEGMLVTDFFLTPLHGEEPWTMTLAGGQHGSTRAVVSHTATHPEPNTRALVWHHPVHEWVQQVQPLPWWRSTPSPRRLERRLGQACADEP